MNNTDPKLISIVTVCYNAADTLQECITSVIDQTYQNIEFILVDGNSTDGTKKILQNNGDKIKFVSETDKGIYDAMNKGLDMANGDWVYFLGADDILINSTIIANIVSSFTDKNAVYYGNSLFKNSGIVYDIDPNKWSLCYRNISHQTLFYPKTVYKKYKYDLKYKIFADHIYNIRVCSDGYRFVHLPEIIALYNDGGRSSYVNDEAYYQDLPGIISNTFGYKYALYVWARIKIFKLKLKLAKKHK